jgi:hypothetical protein
VPKLKNSLKSATPKRLYYRGSKRVMKTKSQLLEKFNHPDFALRLQAGDDSAFRELRDQLFPWLIAFAVKKYRIPEETEIRQSK